MYCSPCGPPNIDTAKFCRSRGPDLTANDPTNMSGHGVPPASEKNERPGGNKEKRRKKDAQGGEQRGEGNREKGAGGAGGGAGRETGPGFVRGGGPPHSPPFPLDAALPF